MPVTLCLTIRVISSGPPGWGVFCICVSTPRDGPTTGHVTGILCWGWHRQRRKGCFESGTESSERQTDIAVFVVVVGNHNREADGGC